ncbi:hypothetical protein HK097_007024 [Rhizophlyctis rosea]|uniref:Uncharacterized protein n=1 Tax=Rhizophlyctis rosea TaxID=64517 RepID=A0AAD5SJI9_9FUNG|nr:hypothetical protein HK097_007024 [Rhizophlyctis rosea]
MSAPGSCKGGARTTGGDNWITASSSQPICLGAIYHPEWRDFQAPASVVQGETIRVTWPCNNHCQQAGKEKIGVYVSQNVADYQLTPSQYLGSKTPFLTGTYGGSLAQDTSLLPVTGKRGYPTGGTEISYLDIKIDSNFKCGLNYLVWAWYVT